VFALYVAGYTAGRFWIELMRTDEATLVFGQRVNVWVSVLVFLGAVAYFVIAKSRGPREDVAALRGTGGPGTDADGTEPTAAGAETTAVKTDGDVETGTEAETGTEVRADAKDKSGSPAESVKPE